MTERLLLFTRDPGATNQILAFLRLLDGDVPAGLEKTMSVLSQSLPLPPKRPTIAILAKDNACQRLTEEGVAFTAWDALVASSDGQSDPVTLLCDRIRADRITHVATGVSDNDDKTHQKVWRAAARCGIPCVTLLDDDTNLAARFLDESGRAAWPDRIYAVSERTRSPLRDLGIPDAAIEVIANLHVSWLGAQGARDHSGEARALRRDWGADEDARVVLFASQPIREMCAYGKPANFDEFACLEELFGRLNQDATPSVVVIRPHPRDVAGKYSHYAGDGPPRTIISNKGSPVSAILAADAVAGMTSMLLQEAETLSRPVMRLSGEVPGR